MNHLKTVIFSGIVGLLGAAACSSIPSNAPVEFSQAKDEIDRAEDEDVDDFFPKTLDRAQLKVDEAIELYKVAEEYKDPGSQGEKRKEAVAGAIEAKTLASNAREAYRRVNSWDSDIEMFAQNSEAKAKVSDLENALRNAKDRVSKLTQDNQGEAAMRITTTAAYFATGKTDLSGASRQRVLEVAEALKANPNLMAEVIGFADARGSKELNEKLSWERARNVANELTSNGVDESKIKVRPVGSKFAQRSGLPAKQQLERRVEIRLLPKSETLAE